MFQKLLMSGGLLVLGAFSASMALRYQDELMARWRFYRYGPDRPPIQTPMGREILEKLETNRRKEVAREYGRVQVAVNTAKSRGANVEKLQRSMDLAMQLGQQGQYTNAIRMLNAVEMQIPTKAENFRAATEDEGFVSTHKTVKGMAVPPKKKPRKPRAKPRPEE